MAEYYTVLKRAVSGPEMSAAEARRAVYDKARNALIGQLKAVEPPLTTAEISRQRLELEEAIRRVERETAAGVVGAAAAAPVTRTPPPMPVERQAPPPPPPAMPHADSELPQASPQDVFRRAMQEAGIRGSESAARMERPAPAPARMPPPRSLSQQRAPVREEPVYRQEPEYRNEPAYEPEPAEPAPRAPANEARLAPEYDQDWEQGRPAPPQPPGPYVDRRERPAAAGGRRRKGYLEEEETNDSLAPPPRGSRLPTILLFVLILGMLGGIGALAYSQRAMMADLWAYVETTAGSIMEGSNGPSPAPAAQQPAQADSTKNADRLLEGQPAPAAPRDVRVVSAPSDPPPLPAAEPLPTAAPAAPAPTDLAVVAAPPPGPSVAPVGPADAAGGAVQKAVLYEEPLDGSAAGVVAVNGTVSWRFIENGPNGPELEASLDVPERAMKIRFALHKNTDSSLPASHLVEVVVDTPADFAGQGIRSVPRIVLKPTEDARGQPLVGAAAKVADGFFWVALSAAPSDVSDNLALLRERNWIDLPLVYENGQRAIITFEKGSPGDQVFSRAISAWSAG